MLRFTCTYKCLPKNVGSRISVTLWGQDNRGSGGYNSGSVFVMYSHWDRECHAKVEHTVTV